MKEKAITPGDRVFIPARDKHGRLERIAPRDGKKGLWARVILNDGSEIHVAPEYVLKAN